MKQQEIKQIKTLIKSAIDLLGESGASINISSREDCSLFVSKLFGFSSWKEISLLEEGSVTNNNAVITSHTPIALSHKISINLPVFKKRKYIPEKNEFKIKEIYLEEHLEFATESSPYLKGENPVFLKPLSTLFVGNSIPETVFANISRGISKSKNSKIVLGNVSNVNLDPWGMMLKGKGLEVFFSNFKDGFATIFTQIVRELQMSGHIINLRMMRDLLSLDGLCSLYKYLQANKMPSSFLLKKFFSVVGIAVEDGEVISEDVHKAYWDRVSTTFNILSTIEAFYEQGVFYQNIGDDELLDLMVQRKDIYIDSSYANLPLYQELVQLELFRASSVYEGGVETYNNPYKYWLLVENLSIWSRLDISSFQNSQIFIFIAFATSDTSILNKALLGSSQVVWAKSSMLNLAADVKAHFIDSVRVWPPGFWYNQLRFLSSLEKDDAYYVYPEPESLDVIDFREKYCRKVKLNI